MRILVSGATGFLGRFVIPRLIEQGHEVTGLSRQAATAQTRAREHSALGIPLLQADLTRWDGGLDPATLRGKFDLFLHMAAIYDLRVTEGEAGVQNLGGTHAALTIAQKAAIPHFTHISTIAVALGDFVSPYPPERLSIERAFSDSYARTKTQAEYMVRQWEHSFASKMVLRLGVLVGDTKGTPPLRIDGPYHAMHALRQLSPWLRTTIGPIPVIGRPDSSRLPIVPVDAVASGIVSLVAHQLKTGCSDTFHLTPRDGGVSARELYVFIMEKIGLDDRKLHFMDTLPEEFQTRLMQFAAGIPKEELEYLLNLPVFDARSTEDILGKDWCPVFSEFQDTLWSGYEKFIAS